MLSLVRVWSELPAGVHSLLAYRGNSQRALPEMNRFLIDAETSDAKNNYLRQLE